MKKICLNLAALLTLSGCWEVGTGNKVGVITRIHLEGFFCKTFEAQIIRGGMNNGSGSFGAPFNFTIESKELAAKAQEALDSQREVKITYHQEFATLCRTSSSNMQTNDGDNYFLDSIEFEGK